MAGNKVMVLKQFNHYRVMLEISIFQGAAVTRSYREVRLGGAWVNCEDLVRVNGRWELKKNCVELDGKWALCEARKVSQSKLGA